MRHFCWGILLSVGLAVGVIVAGCGGSTSQGGGANDLRVVPGQIVRAQELQDGSFSVTAQPLLATGGAPLSGYTWSAASGSAYPPGTSVSALTGVFHGSGAGLTPGTDYSFDVQVTDGSSTATGTITLEAIPCPPNGIAPITVFQQPLGVPLMTLPSAQANRPYAASLQVYGGVPPYSWFEDASYTGRTNFGLSGLTIDMARGVVRGTVMNSAAGKTLRFRIVVRDNTGATAVTEETGPVYQITVR